MNAEIQDAVTLARDAERELMSVQGSRHLEAPSLVTTENQRMSLSSISRQHCATCAQETLHKMCVCVHCRKGSLGNAAAPFNPAIDSAFFVRPAKIHSGSSSSKSRRKASAESGMPAHVAAEGGPR